MDNLPHDKISNSKTGNILQAEIHGEATLQEKFVPLNDALLEKIITLLPAYVPSTSDSTPRWIPTVACGLLDYIFSQCPNSSVIFADFDWLPRPTLESRSVCQRKSVESVGEPLVTDMEDVDHECYLSSPSLCDVLFPTDFNLLARFSENLMQEKKMKGKKKRRGKINPWMIRKCKQSDFLLEFGSTEVEATKSFLTGYTPCLDDFSNCSVLTISRNKVN